MASFYPTQSASRIFRNNNILYTGNATTAISTQFSAQTRQIRVVTNITNGVFVSVTDSSAATVAVVTGGAFVAANNFPEYFTVNPGQIAAINSTSTSSGFVSVTEMTN
jgi:hypothetical protein